MSLETFMTSVLCNKVEFQTACECMTEEEFVQLAQAIGPTMSPHDAVAAWKTACCVTIEPVPAAPDTPLPPTRPSPAPRPPEPGVPGFGPTVIPGLPNVPNPEKPSDIGPTPPSKAQLTACAQRAIEFVCKGKNAEVLKLITVIAGAVAKSSTEPRLKSVAAAAAATAAAATAVCATVKSVPQTSAEVGAQAVAVMCRIRAICTWLDAHPAIKMTAMIAIPPLSVLHTAAMTDDVGACCTSAVKIDGLD